ncbi:hypothetical protein M427DRAFT_37593 [Gonapodya prolifera JEL478]|uniref:SF3 helicase domain-containing protein n=1 Tax=Gonapodya prolifera (strain JEL478) TaxID=1344416 RepID=A0A139A0A5_GONPJ|nr:hypothetical protein M427DRAFT_37593 [Gonapodya prolifera JEL478]|eukprot:KXS10216.1 hypothetical protein M427DRAFT_37593 [Gonapodya prolifera JEL478]
MAELEAKQNVGENFEGIDNVEVALVREKSTIEDDPTRQSDLLNFWGNGTTDSTALEVSFDEKYVIFDDPALNNRAYKALDGTHGHRWRKHKLREEMNINIHTALNETLEKIRTSYMQHPESDLRAKRIGKINNLIKGVLGKDLCHIRNQALPYFFQLDEFFGDNLDANRDLLGFNNGIYDFKRNCFRDGRPEDNVSLSVGYDWVDDSQIPDADFAAVKTFFTDIQPDGEELTYLMTYLSTMLHGGTSEQIFTIFTGRTRNGKGVLADLVKEVLGDYCITVDPKMVTGDRLPLRSPQPDLLELNCKRAVFVSESQNTHANPKLRLDVAFIKLITSNDTISCRALYSNDITHFKPNCKITLLTNKIPEISSDGEEIWGKIRIVEFPITFTENPKDPSERKINKRLKEALPHLRLPMLHTLLRVYREIYCVHGLKPTEKVQ